MPLKRPDAGFTSMLFLLIAIDVGIALTAIALGNPYLILAVIGMCAVQYWALVT